MERVQVLFENGQNTFYCGQYVNGHVSLQLDVPTRLRAITLRVSGTAECKWEEWIHKRSPQKQLRRASLQQNQHPPHEMKVFKSNELYFEYKIALLPASPNDPLLEAGEHKYPFHFNLPHNIPSSFEGHFGYVRYMACCKVDKPCARDHESKTLFTIICPLDLNRFPHLSIQADASDVKKFWGLFRRSKPTTVILRLPESGIVPGQLINPNIDIENNSDVRINQVKLSLVMNSVFTAMGVKKMDKKVILESHLGAVEPKQSRTWFRGIFIQVPAVPPSGLSNCTLIDVSYKLKLVAEPERPHLNINVSLPLTVGTIPFQSHFGSFNAANNGIIPPVGWNNPEPSAPSDSMPEPPESTDASYYSSMPPPSYEESVASGEYLEIHASQAFSPRYPVYSSLPLPPEFIQDNIPVTIKE
ncbi:arrestin domain-containing protein 17-like [Neocloeon triangulifer]|uniref:arrestin domain-containing protein 17-like n=1 Tax=Neocloeon triangulifer TaxID=2078957 RepID=UPI00286EB5E9|nr:arrestin domain-containing protein 17-like [Neocloeon triangulifer]